MKKYVIKLLCGGLCLLLLTACQPQPAPVSTTTAPPTTTLPTTLPTHPPKPQTNPYTAADFSLDGQWLVCSRGEAKRGIDVSAYQGAIDWQKVKAAGVEFAVIRIGFRGYGAAGNMVQDGYGTANLVAAQEAGLLVGAYFFSQATTVAEAEEEAAFALKILDGFQLDLPVAYDWEYISDTARTANVTADQPTAFAQAFCAKVEESGYESMVYFNEHYAAGRLEPATLTDTRFWYAQYDGGFDAEYCCYLWQFSNTGKVPGISGNVDLNIMLPVLYG